VRLKHAHVALLLAVVMLPLASEVKAQNPDTIAPEQSSAKAKQLLQQAIDALGGAAFRNNKELDCEGRLAQFGHSGGMMGFVNYRNYWLFPDKNRTEYVVNSTKGGMFAVLIGNLPIKGSTLVQVFSGDEGWVLTKEGVNEAEATDVAQFQEAVKHNLRNVLLLRVNQEGVYLRYGGLATVDLHPVEWIEITDRDEGSIRLAVDRSTHLPARIVVSSKDEVTGEMDEDVTIFSNYQPHEGIQMPMQVSRLHNDRRTYQLFYNSCNANPNLPADFFTKEGLAKSAKKK
jgi:hypothetical protein